jgi:hypothetical protein
VPRLGGGSSFIIARIIALGGGLNRGILGVCANIFAVRLREWLRHSLCFLRNSLPALSPPDWERQSTIPFPNGVSKVREELPSNCASNRKRLARPIPPRPRSLPKAVCCPLSPGGGRVRVEGDSGDIDINPGGPAPHPGINPRATPTHPINGVQNRLKTYVCPAIAQAIASAWLRQAPTPHKWGSVF